MGYRAAWLKHAGGVAFHSEVVLHALEREIQAGPLRLLVAGVGNGGSLEVWRDVLPEGSTVLGVDSNPKCADLNLPVLVGDVTDPVWVKEALKGQWFDAVIDSTGTMTPWLWAFLTPNGRYVLERYDTTALVDLVACVAVDEQSWLPTEEIMRVNVFPKVAVIEKRSARVLPYLDVLVGNFDEVVSERSLIAEGYRRIIV